MINTFLFCGSIDMMVLMRKRAEMDMMASRTVKNPRAAIYVHRSVTSCQCVWEGKSGSSCSFGPVLGRLGYCVRITDSETQSVVASRIFFGIGKLVEHRSVEMEEPLKTPNLGSTADCIPSRREASFVEFSPFYLQQEHYTARSSSDRAGPYCGQLILTFNP